MLFEGHPFPSPKRQAKHSLPSPLAYLLPLVVSSMGMSLTSKLISRKVLLIIIILSYNIGTIAGILAMPYWQRLFSTGYTDANGNPNITISQESAIISI